MHWKGSGRENLEMRRALRPRSRYRVFFGVDIQAGIAKRGHAPGHRARRFRRSGYAAADLIGQAAKIFRERRFAERVGNDFWGNLLAKRLAGSGARFDISISPRRGCAPAGRVPRETIAPGLDSPRPRPPPRADLSKISWMPWMLSRRRMPEEDSSELYPIAGGRNASLGI